MAKAPEARYPTALAFVQALDAALDGDATASTRVLGPAMADGAVPAAVAGGAGLAAAAAGAAPASAAAGPPAAFTRRLAARSPRPASGGPPRRPIATPLEAVSSSHRRPSRALALIALGLVALGVVLVLTQLGSGSTAKLAAVGKHPANRAARHRPAAAGAKTTHSASSSASTTATSAAAANTSSTAGAAPTSASALQLQGHQELLNGNYTAAIPTLEQAIHAASPGSLPYAYALYDLGDALLRSGNAQAAIPVLEQRLKIPNQTATVQALLNQALRAAGQAPTPVPPSNTGGAPVPPGHDHGHGPGQGKPGKGGH
jgi:hypothetical protein